jgi:aminoglycoside 6'-N-acetyltransferase
VVEWWEGPGCALDDVRRHYLPLIAGSNDATPYLICCDGAPIGYIQSYAVRPGAWGLSDVEGGIGLDLFIGEPRYLHRGLGSDILRQFAGMAFRDTSILACFIDPSPRNRIAVRAFEKAGFRYVADAADPENGQRLRIMRLLRGEFEAAADRDR